MGAKKKPLEVLTLADLGLGAGDAGDGGSKTSVLGIATPPGRVNSVKITDDGNAAQAIVDYLAEQAARVNLLVFLEHHEGALAKGPLGVLAKAAALGDGRGCRGARRRRPLAALAAQAGHFGATTVYIARRRLIRPLPSPRIDVLERRRARPAASTPCCSRTRSSPRMSPPRSRLDSKPASTGISSTSQRRRRAGRQAAGAAGLRARRCRLAVPASDRAVPARLVRTDPCRHRRRPRSSR